VDRRRAIREIEALLDRDDGTTRNTSMRIPVALSAAATLAVDQLGLARSTTGLTAAALRATLEAAVLRAALDQHYHEHPDARPDLADVAVAAAQLDGHPLAATPDVIRTAAAELSERHADVTPDDVLLWAEARAMPAGTAR
jgi:hypothetical protein